MPELQGKPLRFYLLRLTTTLPLTTYLNLWPRSLLPFSFTLWDPTTTGTEKRGLPRSYSQSERLCSSSLQKSSSELKSKIIMKKFFLFLVLPIFLFASPLKAVFDCAVGDLDWISLRLSLIKKTAEQLMEEGKSYRFVITIHSHCIKVVDADLKKFPESERRKIELIQSQLKTLKEMYSVDVKACQIAMNRGKIKKVPPFVETVPNSWITLIELQNKGFAFVPF
ncbi:putative protein [Aquifex aeolicus VF5]|uniref:Uncharacterized protein aq_2020 n=2 Tax=Aquifex aeolicus TaxID=63363 RepID=Y2020_AQUAE|nr:RecName: Full=Uncharacterized protein aq_2020 [Aquifex aeolicus VF5]AAC07785.1 putative protein [Aquifex aeolicus VF5]